MSILGANCAAGIPHFIERDPAGFLPRKISAMADGTLVADCHFCGRSIMVKQNEPRKGFFVEHVSAPK